MIQASLAQALSKLDPLNDNHWTQDGLPRLDTLKMLTGDSTLTREVISSQFPDYKRVGAGAVVLDPVVITPPVIDPPVVIVDTSKITEDESEDESEDEIGVIEEAVYRTELEKEQIYLTELERDYHDAKASYEAQLAVVDKLILDAQNDLTPASDSQQAIRQYLSTQRLVLEERQAKMSMIKESGIDLKKLATDLVAPIDRPRPRRR